MSFFVSLWQSIFEPGTSPQLIIATHVSFTALLLSLIWLIYSTGIIHFYVLFVIATFLWITVIWFINELKQVKLKSNDELEETTSTATTDTDESKKDIAKTTSSRSSASTSAIKSRKA
ncbi:V-type ATPase assembly factor PKR1 [Nakaseomyces bracarensis]|uniref:V-type ATPase assembly factor PKR1 n=1 Tax=Nakaseomyces bracarensis TaxID=273131 RepID=A0ABR4NUX8_9SACH